MGAERAVAEDDDDEADDGLNRWRDPGDGGGASEEEDGDTFRAWPPVPEVEGRAGMRKPSASTRSRDLASRPFQIVVTPDNACTDDAADEVVLSAPVEKIESQAESSPSSDEPADMDEADESRESDLRCRLRLGVPSGDEGRNDRGESECPSFLPAAPAEPAESGDGDRGGTRRHDSPSAAAPDRGAGVGEKTSASAAGRGRTGVGGMMSGEASKAVGGCAAADLVRCAGEPGCSAALVMAWRAFRPPGGATIWTARVRLTGEAGGGGGGGGGGVGEPGRGEVGGHVG